MLIKKLTGHNNGINDYGVHIDKYLTFLGEELSKLGATNVKKGGGTANGSNINLTDQATVDREGISWVRDVATLGDVTGNTNISISYKHKTSQYLTYQYGGVKILISMGTSFPSSLGSGSVIWVYYDFRGLPNNSTSLLPQNKQMLVHGITSDSDLQYYLPYYNSDFRMETTIFLSVDKRSLSVSFRPVTCIIGAGRERSIEWGTFMFDSKYGIAIPSNVLMFNDKVDGLTPCRLVNTVSNFTTILAGSTIGDRANGVMPTGELFLGLENSAILCKAQGVITLPYNYPVSQNISIGNKIYHKIPAMQSVYSEVE